MITHTFFSARPIGQKVGQGGQDPIASLASAIKLGQNPRFAAKNKI
jgi:hypothetical protein